MDDPLGRTKLNTNLETVLGNSVHSEVIGGMETIYNLDPLVYSYIITGHTALDKCISISLLLKQLFKKDTKNYIFLKMTLYLMGYEKRKFSR